MAVRNEKNATLIQIHRNEKLEFLMKIVFEAVVVVACVRKKSDHGADSNKTELVILKHTHTNDL